MKKASAALQALLASRQFWACHLYVFTLVGGGVLRYSGGDCDVVDTSGNRYSCGGMTGPYFETTANTLTVHQKLGTDVDTLSLDIAPGAGTIFGEPFLQAVRQGLFRGATFQLLRAYAPTVPSVTRWPVPVTGTVVKFTGIAGEIDAGGSLVTMTVDSALVLLQSQWPRNYYSPSCVNSLGDAACGVSLAAYAVVGQALAGSSNGFVAANLASGAGYYDLGHMAFTSGANNGLSRSIDTWDGVSLNLMTPFPNAPAPNDAFVVWPGCDGIYESGCAKFGNQANFRGFRTIPAPTTAT